MLTVKIELSREPGTGVSTVRRPSVGATAPPRDQAAGIRLIRLRGALVFEIVLADASVGSAAFATFFTGAFGTSKSVSS